MTLALLVVFFALANRFSGGGLGWRPTFRGRPIYYAAAAAGFLLGFLYGLPGILAALWFLLWRLPGWYGGIDAGTDKGSRLSDGSIMAARAMPFAALLLVTAPAGVAAMVPALDQPDVWPAVLVAGAFIATSLIFSALVALAYDQAWHPPFGRRPRDPVAVAEVIVGALWGVLIWWALG